ncbi:MAG: DUF421 domain-containing protein [Bacillota bacterium]|nr:DUF421 domain-containing protein [Bacillota bacterium]MDP4161256.1 DUF421 domain-containing protein [Bacillota bacterium]
MELTKELLIVASRVLIILSLFLGITLYMGKRSIGELPVFDLLVMLTLGAIVGADIADPKVPLLPTVVAIILIGLFQKFISTIIIKYRKLGHMITFEPTIVIQEGQFIMSNLKKVRYSIDNVLQLLREKDVFDLRDVHMGIIEANGSLSVLKKGSKASITIEDMNLTKQNSSISYPVIVDGEIYENVLLKLELSNDWLKRELLNLNIKTPMDVFFASVNTKKELHVSLKSYLEDQQNILPVFN